MPESLMPLDAPISTHPDRRPRNLSRIAHAPGQETQQCRRRPDRRQACGDPRDATRSGLVARALTSGNGAPARPNGRTLEA